MSQKFETILVVDTSLPYCRVAVRQGEKVFFQSAGPMRRGQDAALPGVVAAAMAEAGINFQALDGLGVVTGPGSFTGLRVGLAYIKGIAIARQIPVTAISNLALYALITAADHGVQNSAAAVPIKSDSVIWQAFGPHEESGDFAALNKPAEIAPSDFVTLAHLKISVPEAVVSRIEDDKALSMVIPTPFNPVILIDLVDRQLSNDIACFSSDHLSGLAPLYVHGVDITVDGAHTVVNVK